MRRLALPAVLPMVAAVLAATGATPAHASCAASVTWKARTYLLAPATVAVPAVAPKAKTLQGTIPPCHDTVAVDPTGRPLPVPDEPAQPVPLHRARNVDPRVAVLYRGALYVTVACNDQLAEAVPPPVRLPARCGR
jgi:hypothetical protein